MISWYPKFRISQNQWSTGDPGCLGIWLVVGSFCRSSGGSTTWAHWELLPLIITLMPSKNCFFWALCVLKIMPSNQTWTLKVGSLLQWGCSQKCIEEKTHGCCTSKIMYVGVEFKIDLSVQSQEGSDWDMVRSYVPCANFVDPRVFGLGCSNVYKSLTYLWPAKNLEVYGSFGDTFQWLDSKTDKSWWNNKQITN